ncbi:hypothetical protein Fcan01_24943 [Folsomia candida]|uniref:Uncharacterized protein n=1 Tax=Folsomia candida TaxID=158441 RepID=A0A226D5P8_FOLCA|nr:hypothetical protein Fcan01_24943 [Folsomia candida]
MNQTVTVVPRKNKKSAIKATLYARYPRIVSVIVSGSIVCAKTGVSGAIRKNPKLVQGPEEMIFLQLISKEKTFKREDQANVHVTNLFPPNITFEDQKLTTLINKLRGFQAVSLQNQLKKVAKSKMLLLSGHGDTDAPKTVNFILKSIIKHQFDLQLRFTSDSGKDSALWKKEFNHTVVQFI